MSLIWQRQSGHCVCGFIYLEGSNEYVLTQ